MGGPRLAGPSRRENERTNKRANEDKAKANDEHHALGTAPGREGEKNAEKKAAVLEPCGEDTGRHGHDEARVRLAEGAAGGLAEEAEENGGAQLGAVVLKEFLEDVVPGVEEGQIKKRVENETAKKERCALHAKQVRHGKEEGVEVRGAARRRGFAGGEDEGLPEGDLLRGLAVEERVGLRAGDGEGTRRQHRADEVVGENLQAAEEEEDLQALGGGGSNGHGGGAGIRAADRLGQSTKRIDGHNAAVHLSVIQVFRQDAALSKASCPLHTGKHWRLRRSFHFHPFVALVPIEAPSIGKSHIGGVCQFEKTTT